MWVCEHTSDMSCSVCALIIDTPSGLSREEGDDDDEEDEVLEPSRKRLKLASGIALQESLQSGLYPEFLGEEGPVEGHSPEVNNALDYFKLLWPDALTSLIADESNRYAGQKKRSNWVDVTTDEVWTFLGIIITMGIHRLPRIRDYWSSDSLLGVPAVQQAMSLNRFWDIWSNIHVVDNDTLHGKAYASDKIKPVVDTLSETFLKYYSPGQEICVDETMVKYKGHCKGKVRMPKKPVKLGYKIWCCSCCCCGYLCSFQVYNGTPTDPETGERVPEKGLVKKVVTDLVEPFKGVNHVVYCDNFFTSGPLVDTLAQDQVFLVGTIKKRALGFPSCLKDVNPPKGTYVSTSVSGVQYFVFNDRKEVCFVSNVFPESMKNKVFRLQQDGFLREQSVPPPLPAYNKYMCAVDVTGQIKKTYGFDRKSKRSWIRLFYAFHDLSIDNAHILYKHNCTKCSVKPKDQLSFRLELAHLLLQIGSRSSALKQPRSKDDQGLCLLKRVAEIGLKRGRCHQCLKKKREKPRCSSFGCSVCKVRLCKTTCFAEYHR